MEDDDAWAPQQNTAEMVVRLPNWVVDFGHVPSHDFA